MVRLTVFLCDQLHVEQLFLEDKADLCRDTEVGRSDQNDFLKHGVLGELMGVFNLGVQLLLFHHV